MTELTTEELIQHFREEVEDVHPGNYIPIMRENLILHTDRLTQLQAENEQQDKIIVDYHVECCKKNQTIKAQAKLIDEVRSNLKYIVTANTPQYQKELAKEALTLIQQQKEKA